MTPSITIETITPEVALDMLVLNTNNRPLRPGRVAEYAEEMCQGRWLLTGEPIIMNGTVLLNGQHRLHACVEAEVPFTTAVFRGADSNIFPVVDNGMPRTHGQVLDHVGVANAATVAAAARLVLGYDKGVIGLSHEMRIVGSKLAIVEEVTSHFEEYTAAATTGRGARRAGINESAWTAAVVILGRLVGDAANDFLEGALSGEHLTAGDPRLVLRSWAVQQGRMAGMTNYIHLSVIIRAWNQYVAGTSSRGVKRWHTGEPFPQFKARTPKQKVA